jgi:glycosyltransferase involved in cell wall biosynthesis
MPGASLEPHPRQDGLGTAAEGGCSLPADFTLRDATTTPVADTTDSRGPRPPRPIAGQSWPAGTRPAVSVLCLTYNHAPFIRDCLEGFLLQQTTFPVEVLVHDDASSDGTAEIVREYETRFPNLIKAICQSKNQHSQGIGPFHTFLLPQAQGSYVAVCEGDDYWTAPHKLQKQVEFMEANPGYSGCFHNVAIRFDDQSAEPSPEPSVFFPSGAKASVTLEDLVLENVIPTPSILFRAGLFGSLPATLANLPVGDWPLHVLNAQHGPMGYLDEVLAVYRRHGGGIWSSLARRAVYEKTIVVARAIDAHLQFRYATAIGRRIAYWHYRIAAEMSRDGSEDGIVRHLLQALRYRSDEIPTADVLRLLFKHTTPKIYSVVYWRWQRMRQRIRRHRSAPPTSRRAEP